ncbi:hypothetical protein FDP41_006459 [Naegleria fowleri]|uniref:Uncharacterized protein n=1 Tax=Naegleria fowleri TaxID=5763 RepID=A0A6A5BBA0_NAEFO|nr:uncharacterized protein FDP41_006459 [Naegleria fowleri]KAF0974427.1 hypothetical protein FDP41_006459 [Naegleria fowleri]CAG4717343.1 unnamed protein product [Naegleria fowleri]
MQYHPEFKDVILFIQKVLNNERGISVDDLWSVINEKKDKLLTTREGLCTWLQRHGFVIENNVVFPPTRSEVKNSYVETIDFVKSIIVDNVIPPRLAELCSKTSSEVFEIKKAFLQEMFEWEGVSGLKEQLLAQVKIFVPSDLVCEVFVDEFKAIYLGSCVPRADKNDHQKYFAIFGYFCDSPVLIAEERCDFGFRFKYKVPNEPGVVITHWENDERTLQDDVLDSPCTNALETLDEYSAHPLQSHIENYLKYFQGIVEEEDISEDSFNHFKSQVLAIITDVKWIIFSTLVKTTHLTASEKLVLDTLSDKSELFTKFPVHWLTVICLALGRDPATIKKYIKNKNKDLLATEIELKWKQF